MAQEAKRKKSGSRRRGAIKSIAMVLLLLLPGLAILMDAIAHQTLATQLGLREKFLIALVFAGFPSIVVHGGIGARLAARAGQMSRSKAVAVGSTKGALAGIGIGLLAAIPIGALPLWLPGWLPLLILSALLSAATGALAALWIHSSTSDHRPDSRNEDSIGISEGNRES